MDILLQSDGQLYPPRHLQPSKPKPPPKPIEKSAEPPPPPIPAKEQPSPSLRAIPWEELLLAGIAFLVIKGDEKPDIPLLLALAYVLFDPHFSLQNLL